jgi:predicted permease
MSILMQDLRIAFRQLARSPGFTAIGVVSMAVGVSVTTLVFSVVATLLLRTYGLPEGPSAVRVLTVDLTYDQAARIRDAVRSQLDLAALRPVRMTLASETGQETVNAELVSGDYFATLGLQPASGRLLDAQSDAGSCAISHGLWQRRYGGDPGVVGRTLRMGTLVCTVQGVAAPAFRGTTRSGFADVWLLRDRAAPGGGDQGWSLVGRLRGDATEARAQSALAESARRLPLGDPDTGRAAWVGLQSLAQEERMRMGPVFVLTAIASLVLLAACTNVAGLLAARAEKRRQEMVIRLALGGSRLRLVRQLLTESLVLAIAGSTLGLLATLWLTDLTLSQLAPYLDPLRPRIRVDWGVLELTLALAGAATLAAGLLPALRASRPDLLSALKGVHPRWRRRWGRLVPRHVWLVGQLVVCFTFVATAGLFVRGMYRGLGLDPAFATERLLLAQLTARASDASRARVLWDDARERVSALPGVTDVCLASQPPLLPGRPLTVFVVHGGQARPADVQASVSYVSPRCFEMTATRLVRGRLFTEQEERLDAPVVVVSEQAARRLWPLEEPLGQPIRVGGPSAQPYEVVGVVRDPPSLIGDAGRVDPASYRPILIFPHGAAHATETCLLVQTARPGASVVAAVRRELTSGAGRVELGRLETLHQLIERASPERLGLLFFGILGLLASLLAMVGLHGVLAQVVERRTPEIGVRIALGASQADTVGLVLRQGLLLAGVGVALGLPSALAVERLLRAGLQGVPATDATVLTAAGLAVVGVALVGSYLPARRAARVDPMVALRCE